MERFDRLFVIRSQEVILFLLCLVESSRSDEPHATSTTQQHIYYCEERKQSSTDLFDLLRSSIVKRNLFVILLFLRGKISAITAVSPVLTL